MRNVKTNKHVDQRNHNKLPNTRNRLGWQKNENKHDMNIVVVLGARFAHVTREHAHRNSARHPWAFVTRCDRMTILDGETWPHEMRTPTNALQQRTSCGFKSADKGKDNTETIL